MINMHAVTTFHAKEVRDAVIQAQQRALDRCALAVRNEAVKSMKAGGQKTGPNGERVQVPSAPGTPPHAQTRVLRNSIQTARPSLSRRMIGPTRMAWYGRIHEFGAMIRVTPRMRGFLHTKGIHISKGKTFIKIPARPFMRPALARARVKFAREFANLRLHETPAGSRLDTMA